MSPGITDSRWPPRRPAQTARPALPGSALEEYPSYLRARVVATPRRTSPLLLAATAYVASFVAQVLAIIPLTVLVVVQGVGVLSRPHTDAELDHAALVAVVTSILVVTLVGTAAGWAVLHLRGVRGGLGIAFAGVLADTAGNWAGSQAAAPVGYALGVLAGITVMYVLVCRRTTPA
jgi:hypothetical protein